MKLPGASMRCWPRWAGEGMGAALQTASVWILPIILAITFHEAAHGYVALRLGDDTAQRLGRVSFNPIKHIDPMGTILIPAMLLLAQAPFLFGYAKPVPVNFGALNNPRRDMVWVALAGPATNIVLALVSAFLLHLAVMLPKTFAIWSVANLQNAILIMLVLAVFNMVPLPPLDGGRVAVGLLPDRLARPLARLERWGLWIIVGALFVLPYLGRRLGMDLNIFSWLIGEPVRYLFRILSVITGLG